MKLEIAAKTDELGLKPGAVGSTQAGDNFGSAVAISGDTVVVGAWMEDSSTTGVNSAANESAADAGAAYVFTGFGPIVVPEIAIEQPAGTTLLAGASTINFGPRPVGSFSAAVFTIRNLGATNLTITAPTVSGANASDFSINSNGTLLTIPGGQQTSFAVTFHPLVGGARTATQRIASNDDDENPFDITLAGTSLVTTQDTDNDGMNDLAEFNMSSLGFNWQVNQAALVNTYYSNANVAGLYDQTQYNANRTAGRNDVINAPNTYSLYTLSQVGVLHVGVPLLTRDPATGKFKLTIGVKKSTNLANMPFADSPMNGAGMTSVINAEGKLEFAFPVSDNTAFFRLESSAIGRAGPRNITRTPPSGPTSPDRPWRLGQTPHRLARRRAHATHRHAAAEWEGAGRGRAEWQLSRDGGALRSGHWRMERDRFHGHRTRTAHRDAAAQRQGARRRRIQWRLRRQRGNLRSGHGDMERDGRARRGTPATHRDAAARWPGARRGGLERHERQSRQRGDLRSGDGTWSDTGALGTGRRIHTATLLPGGKVLVAGGLSGSNLASAELYDPATGTWSGTGALAAARGNHTAMLLPTGKVLVAGGRGGSSYLNSAELYDPVAGT